MCDDWAWTKVGSIRVTEHFYYIETGYTHIQFSQETTYVRFLAKITAIHVKSIINNPVYIEDYKYNCEINGTGKMDHFGGSATSYPPPEININCLLVEDTLNLT